jgi:sigma-B regulation protein RsbU (phosphoserine phosphatase)
VKDTIKAYGYEGVSPAVAMEKTNLVLTRAANAESRGETQFVTAFYGVLDTATGRLTYSVSGHPPGIVRHNSETVFLSGCSPVLGVFETVGFQDGETHLGPGDLLVLYTDGLTEARSQGEFFGEQRLLSLVATMGDRPVSEVPQAIFTGALEFTGGNFSDDVAILAVALE